MQTLIIFITNITWFCLPVISEAPWPLVPWFLPPCLGLSPSCYRGSSGKEPRQSPHAGPSSLTTSLSSCKSCTKKKSESRHIILKRLGYYNKAITYDPSRPYPWIFFSQLLCASITVLKSCTRHLENLVTLHLKRIVTWVSLPSFELRDDQEASQRSFWGSRAARSSSTTRSSQPSSSRLRRPKRRQRNLKPPLNSNFFS